MARHSQGLGSEEATLQLSPKEAAGSERPAQEGPQHIPGPRLPQHSLGLVISGESACARLSPHTSPPPPQPNAPLSRRRDPRGRGGPAVLPGWDEADPALIVFACFSSISPKARRVPRHLAPRSSVWNASEASILDKRKALVCVCVCVCLQWTERRSCQALCLPHSCFPFPRDYPPRMRSARGREAGSLQGRGEGPGGAAQRAPRQCCGRLPKAAAH